MPVDQQVDPVVEEPDKSLQEWRITPASKASVTTTKGVLPLVLIADIAFAENRLPARGTIGRVPSRPGAGRGPSCRRRTP
ncbi:hypothetical protein ACFPH6_46645 [Streptomyces xiangluensis]|uniref:Uncharacterized protein n=1 Tax=Streptomyces xiangluensis TaxID=2665720 RepID=A0ABV8Z532_9ACTN